MIYPKDTAKHLKDKSTAFAVECGLTRKADMKRPCGFTNAEYFLACAKAYYRGRSEVLREISINQGRVRVSMPYRLILIACAASFVLGALMHKVIP